MYLRQTLLISLLFGTACATFPELDATIDPELPNTEAPGFLTQDQLSSAAESPDVVDPILNTTTRLNRLQSRANALRRPVLTRKDGQRLETEIR